MAESTGVIPRIDGGAEVELSAQELLALADFRLMEESESATRQPSRPATTASAKVDAPKASINRHVTVWRLSLAIIATAGMVGSAYLLRTSDPANQARASTPQQTTQSEWPGPVQLAHGEPVRFANPFDADEVFEFPPGTSEAEARDAVAELLLERAMSRQKT